MKILIIATPRTGSSTLAHRLGVYLNLKTYFEPFNFLKPLIDRELQPDYVPDNCVVKCIVDQIPKDVKNDAFYQDYSKKFDKVILLARKNITEQIESYNWFCNQGRLQKNQPYVYTKQPDYSIHEEYIIRVDKMLKALQLEQGVRITYYEDIYRFELTKQRVDERKRRI
jgi:hypothetical protein